MNLCGFIPWCSTLFVLAYLSACKGDSRLASVAHHNESTLSSSDDGEDLFDADDTDETKTKLKDAPSGEELRSQGSSQWVFITPFKPRIRNDSMGRGAFSELRNRGLHVGLDFEMPQGTALLSPCDGHYYRREDNNGFGKWVQIFCKVPTQLDTTSSLYASFLFAHLEVITLKNYKCRPGTDPEELSCTVKKGEKIGDSGSTGNAMFSGITPHLHIEVALQTSFQAALDEAHQGKTDAPVPDKVGKLISNIKTNCLKKNGFKSDTLVNIANKIDPFLLLICGGATLPSKAGPGKGSFGDSLYK